MGKTNARSSLKLFLALVALLGVVFSIGASKQVREAASPHIRSAVQTILGTAEPERPSPSQPSNGRMYEGFFEELAAKEATELRVRQRQLRERLDDIKRNGTAEEQARKLRTDIETLEAELRERERATNSPFNSPSGR